MTTLTKKQKNLISFYDICFIISAIAMGAILWSHPQDKLTIVSLGTYAIGLSAMAMYVKHLLTYLNRMSLQGLFLILLIVVSVLAIFYSHRSLKSDIVSLLCFLEIPIFMLCSSELKSKRPAEVFIWVQYILSFYYLYLSRTDKAYLFRGYYGVIELEELTLSYNNPNETSMYLICCLLTLLAAISFYKQIWLKIIFIFNAAAVFNLIFLTQCRAGIIAASLAVIGLLLHKFIKVKMWFTRLAMFVPAVMVVLIYFFNDMLIEIKILGESFESGRKSVFDSLFNNLNSFEFFSGDFANYAFENLHNVYISIFATIGIFGTLFYILFFDKMFKTFARKKVQPESYQKMAYICLLILIIYSSVESALFCSGSAFAMCFISLYTLFALKKEKTNSLSAE